MVPFGRTSWMTREHGILSRRGFFRGSSRCVSDKRFSDTRQDFARKRFVGNGTRQCNRTEHGAVGKDGLLPSRRRGRVAEQSGKQSNIAADLLGVEFSHRLTAAAHIADEGADRATGTNESYKVVVFSSADPIAQISTSILILTGLMWPNRAPTLQSSYS